MRYVVLLTLIALHLVGDEVLVRSPYGDSLMVDIDPEASFAEAIARMEGSMQLASGMHAESPKTFLVDFMVEASPSKLALPSPRNFARSVSAREKEDIRYILVTLATHSWLQLLGDKSSLKRAGDRIDHIHPLQFLICIFTDEELKASVHSIRDRSKIWSEFFDGLANSLEEEYKRNNLQTEQIEHFAAAVNIDQSVIASTIQKRQWQKTLDQLLLHLPRGGPPQERYNQ